jgi:HAD superfamily hydrolase (TIGR01450 family)
MTIEAPRPVTPCGLPQVTDIRTLEARYRVLLLDAYGVLVDESGPLPGARALVERLNRSRKPYYLLTNSASHLPETFAGLLASRGVPVPVERVLSAGLLLRGYLERRGLVGQRCLVLGTEDAFRYVEAAGGVPIAPDATADAAVVVVADQVGFPLPEGLDLVVSLCLRRLAAGEPLHLVLCNPDLIYPKSPGQYGITAGALAVVIEAVLAERFPLDPPRFDRLGKPYTALFEEAARRAGTLNMVMVGDQLATDVLGARRFGIDSAFLATGPAQPTYPAPELTPTWLLPTLE